MNRRGVTPLGIAIGLIVLFLGIAVFLVGYQPGWFSNTLFIAGTPAIILDIGGLALVVLGAVIAWRF